MRRGLIALALAVGLASAPVAAPAEREGGLHPYTATYSVSRGNMRVGRMRVELARTDQGCWLYESHSRTTGFISFLRDYRIHETTRFRVIENGVVPFQHVYTLTGDRKDRNFALAFDWTELEVRGIVSGEAVTGELTPGAIDRHTILLSSVLDLRSKRPFPYRLMMIDRAEQKEVEVRIDGEERLNTAAGAFDTVRVVQQRVDDADKRLILWLAVAERHLPVRVASVDDDGKTITLDLVEFEFQSMSAAPVPST
ncbi:MAG: DUF3108 domain-containing protein [Xanthomonadaceae bacterium]|nr:DUF3108 domain-containing protein [Xanthomonadaceae bacterium]